MTDFEKNLIKRIMARYHDDTDVECLVKHFIAERNINGDEIRRCDNCGIPMKEGYYLAGEFACSDDCCLALYDGDKELMHEELSHADEPDGDCYYTEWDGFRIDE